MQLFKIVSATTAALIMSTTFIAGAQEGDSDVDEPSVDETADLDASTNIDESVADEPPADDSAPIEEAPTPSNDSGAENSKAGGDGGRFRFGISGGPGIFSVKPKGGGTGVGFTYGGMDLRFGAQINDLLGVYAQPVLGYYSTGDAGIFGVGGLLGASVIADATLLDHFFVGGGVGYHIYNNPAGASLVFRAGGYPIMGRSKEKIRRKGLMLGADLRVSFLSDFAPIIQPTFNLGYEAF